MKTQLAVSGEAKVRRTYRASCTRAYKDELPEYKPLARIYNPASAGSVLQQDYSVTRMRWLSDAPPRFLDKLTIRIRLPNGAPIEDAYKNNHSLTFSVVALSHASEKVPAFLQSIATL